MSIRATLALAWQVQNGFCKGLEGFFARKEPPARLTKSVQRGDIKCDARSSITQNTFRYRATTLWNLAPKEFKYLTRSTPPKKEIALFARAFPI